MSGAEDAAAAVLRAQPAGLLFPAKGVLRRLNVWRGINGTGPITAVTGVAVAVDGILYNCGVSGAFIAEISVASTDPTYPATDYVGREVKVEQIGGQLVVAYTINRG